MARGTVTQVGQRQEGQSHTGGSEARGIESQVGQGQEG